MSDETNIETIESAKDETKAPPTHGEMFFRYVAALAQAAGVQAFTMAVAVPKDDGTSSVMSFAAGVNGTPREWQLEIARLLGEQAMIACKNIVTAPADKPDEITAPAEVV